MPAWFILMMPQLIAGLSKLLASRVALNKQNRYNSPIEQMRRIREAGLPFAAFEAGQAGSQSQLPDLSGFDTIGSAVGTGITQGNQMKLFFELLRKAGFDADIRGNEADISTAERDALMNNFVDYGAGNKVPIAGAKKLAEFEITKFGQWSAGHKEAMDAIDRKIKEERFDSGRLVEILDEEFDRLVNTNKAMRQAWQGNEDKDAAFKTIVEIMKGSDGKLGFMEALLIQIMKSLSGGVSGGGVNLGF